MSIHIDKDAMRKRLLEMLDSYISEAEEHEDEATFDPTNDPLDERMTDFVIYWATQFDII